MKLINNHLEEKRGENAIILIDLESKLGWPQKVPLP